MVDGAQSKLEGLSFISLAHVTLIGTSASGFPAEYLLDGHVRLALWPLSLHPASPFSIVLLDAISDEPFSRQPRIPFKIEYQISNVGFWDQGPGYCILQVITMENMVNDQ